MNIVARTLIAVNVATLLTLCTSGARGDDSATADESRFLTTTRALTYQGNRAGEGYFSPDGKYLIFQSERDADNPYYQIYIMSLESGETHRVSPGKGKTTCAFFRPGSDDVLFASTHMDRDAEKKQKDELELRASGKQRRYAWDYDENFDIFSAHRDGSGLKRLTKAVGYDAEGSYSPDGKRIVFCSMRDAYPAKNLSDVDRKRLEMDPSYFGEIYIMDADGGNAKRLTDWAGYDGGPFFSPDGARIIWRHFDESGLLADVYTMNTDGGDRRRLTDFGSMCWAPYFHPSGKYVIFTSNKEGFSNFELYLVDAAGLHEPVRVTNTDGFDGLPVFSPDGNQLAWTSNRTPNKKSQIFIAQWNHDAAMQAVDASPRRDVPYVRTSDITAADLRADVDYLASDELEGRMTGTKGTELAAKFIIDRLEEAGVKPMGDNGGYTQDFPFTSGVNIIADKNTFSLSGVPGADTRYELDHDFRPMAFSADGDAEGEIVFAGYGLVVPGAMGEGYDSYAGLDVTGKVVLVLRYAPEDVDMERRQVLNHYAGIRYKAMLARERGASAVLVATGPNSPNAGELIPLKYDQSLASSGIVVASISDEVARRIFAAAGKDLKEVQSELDIENPHFEGAFAIPAAKAKITTAVAKVKRTGQNIIGVIPPAPHATQEFVMIGAHYDHIGYGEIGSLAHKGEEGQIHNGADDNASGTATVLELAAAIAEVQKRGDGDFDRGVIVALWSGEELGVIGSSYFASNPTVPLDRIKAYLNFDMVGRLRDNKLMVQGAASSSNWTEMVEKRNVAAGFNLVLQDDPYLPTDVTSFYPKEIPVLSFFTGSHEDYNRPTDDAATLNYEGMERIGTFADALVMDLVRSKTELPYARVEQNKEPGGGRAALRAYLGTIPDYSKDAVEGVMLSGVRTGGPADKAGVLGGDVIVMLAGQKIANIYDYTYALDAVKIGKPVEMVVRRADRLVTLTVVPEARE